MNFRTTVVLFVLVVVAAVTAFILHKCVPDKETGERLAKQVFRDLKSDEATKLEIKTKDKTFAFEKKDDKWHMSGPLKVRADKSTVLGVIDTCESLNKVRDVELKGKEPDLAKYELKNPQTTITVWTKPKDAKEETKFVLLVGKKSPSGDNVYVMREDKKQVLVVDDRILEKATKDVNEFRDKTVMEIETSDVEKIELAQAGAKPIECAVKEKEGWFVTQPISDFGDKGKIEDVIKKLKDLKIDKNDFISEDDSDLKKYGLDKPKATVTVYQKGSGKTLLLGKKAEKKTDKIYAKRKAEPSIFAVKNSILSDLSKTPNDLRSRKVVDIVSTGDINKIEIKLPSETALIEKKDDKWQIVKPVEEKADTSSVDDFLDSVKNLVVQDWVAEKSSDLKTYGLDKPIEVSLGLKDEDAKPLAFLVGSKDKKGEKLYVKRATSDVILAVAPGILPKLLPGRLNFRDKKILEFTKSEARKLTVARKDKPFVAVSNDGTNWKLEKPIKADADKTTVGDILWDLSYLKANSYIAESPKDLKPYGLDKPAITATVEYDEGIKTQKKDAKEAKKDEAKKDDKPKKKRVTKTVLVGKKTDTGDYYAMLKGGKFVFTVRSSVVDHFTAEPASRKICSFDKDIATKLSLALSGKEYVFEKKAEKDNKWWQVKPVEKKADQSDVSDVLNDLDDFRADGIEAYSTKDPKAYGFDKPELKVTVTLRGEGEKVLVVGKMKKDKKQYFVRCQPSSFVFLVDEADIRRLMDKAPVEKKKPKAKPATQPKPKPAAKPKPKPSAQPKAKPTAQPKAEPKPTAKPKTTPAPKAKPPAAKPAAKPTAKPAPAPAAKPKPTPKKPEPAKPKTETKPTSAPAKPADTKKTEQTKPAPAGQPK